MKVYTTDFDGIIVSATTISPGLGGVSESG